MSWNYGDILDGCDALKDPAEPALIHAGVTTTWGDFKRRTNNLAHALCDRGAKAGDKVAFYMRNSAAYTESLAACFKARLVPVNVNYRYLDEELHYILENSDACFVVFDAEFLPHVEHLRERLPNIQWLQSGGSTAEWAADYQQLAESGQGEPLNIQRSGEDLLFIYTGGTTGMPKAVMWEHENLWHALGAGTNYAASGGVAPATLEQHLANLAAYPDTARQLTACPLMHGTGMLTVISLMAGGGCNITLGAHGLDCEELWQAVEDSAAQAMVIVGDAFARPMLKSLRENPGRWNLDSLKAMISSGVMWSSETKSGLLEHHADMVLADMFGSSEAVGFGASMTSSAGGSGTARFMIGEQCQVFTEDHRAVVPGSGERGFIARAGAIPLGYYKDPEKTAKTFPTIGGVRYSIPGDWCTVEADGSLTLLGRGSVCINSGGEKIYPEEVEEQLKSHPAVQDALVFGLQDPDWGQAVTAVVYLEAEAAPDELRGYVREHLAAYKVPKRIAVAPSPFRAPNGKADYKAARAWFESTV